MLLESSFEELKRKNKHTLIRICAQLQKKSRNPDPRKNKSGVLIATLV